ncbi:MAG: MBL fold metallo-hydrolase [Methanomicrobiales archaeon]|nr:MBL fold metallo-hydrolase [Methanomicrobiales archaeon]
MQARSVHYLICLILAACIMVAGCSIPGGRPEIVPGLPHGDLLVHFIDVGQGDSILVEFRDKAMLVDAGERDMGEHVIAYIRSRGIERLDVVVATHAHSDHIGGLRDVISTFPVGRFIDAGQPHPTVTYENLLTRIEELGIPYVVAERGQTIALDPDLEILIENPGKKPLGDINEDSIVLKVTYEDVSYLLTGDAGRPAEESMMKAGLDLDADVLKVGHHASRHASSAGFLAAVSPSISVITVGAGNDYGHPHEEVLERLGAIGSRIHRTDLEGTVIVATDGRVLAVTTEGNPSPSLTPRVTITQPPSGVYIAGLDLLDEEVLITNADATAANLTGWMITDEGTRNTYTFPLFTLDAGASVTVHTGPGNDTVTDLYWGRKGPVWNNDGDIATLSDPAGGVVSIMER